MVHSRNHHRYCLVHVARITVSSFSHKYGKVQNKQIKDIMTKLIKYDTIVEILCHPLINRWKTILITTMINQNDRAIFRNCGRASFGGFIFHCNNDPNRSRTRVQRRIYRSRTNIVPHHLQKVVRVRLGHSHGHGECF